MAVLFHVSHAYIAVWITIAVYRRNVTFKLIVVDDHIGRSSLKMDAAFLILEYTSGPEPPSLASNIWELLDVMHVLLHNEDGSMLLRPDLHGLGILAIYPKSSQIGRILVQSGLHAVSIALSPISDICLEMVACSCRKQSKTGR